MMFTANHGNQNTIELYLYNSFTGKWAMDNLSDLHISNLVI